MLAFMRELRRETESSGDPALVVCGESNALLICFTNWTKADFFNVADFGSAVVRGGKTGQIRSNAPGTIVSHHAQSMRQNLAARNVFVVLGKDNSDNYWLTGILPPAAWINIERDLNRMR